MANYIPIFHERQTLTVQFSQILCNLLIEYRSIEVIAILGGDHRAGL